MKRFDTNPLISPRDAEPLAPGFEIIGTFNAGAVRVGEEVLLLVRVAERPLPEPGCVAYAAWDPETGGVTARQLPLDTPGLDLSDPRVVCLHGQVLLSSISHIRIARSRDGVRFSMEEEAAIAPEGLLEEYGVEDPRITPIDGRFIVNYSAISSVGISTVLAETQDFRSFRRLGAGFCPDNKDVAVFPERIGGLYVAFHRPSSGFSPRPAMWLATSPDLVHWGNHTYLMGPRRGEWDSSRIGCGAVPIKTEKGWLEIYHGVDRNGVYSLGCVLLDLEDPSKVLARSREPVLRPEAPYEREGFVPNVCFACGAVETDDGRLLVYYGGADTVVCGAETSVEELLSGLL